MYILCRYTPFYKNNIIVLSLSQCAPFSDVVQEEERKCQIIEEDVTLKQKMCEQDLEKAMPALDAAQDALNTLNKVSSYLKSSMIVL